MKRKEAREKLMTVIYQTDVNRSGGPEEYLDKLPEEDSQFSYIKETAEAWQDNRDEVDSIISEHTKGWKLERMPRVDLAILREAVTEIMFMDDIPSAVTINEAVELAKTFGTPDSAKFINAVLGQIERSGR